MTEDQLLGPRAYGAPCGTAQLKASPEDFQVDELLDIPLSGAGEHLWLWVEKRGLNTEEAARRLARAAGVPVKAISYAGLKDRQALTRQWFSLHLPGQQDPDLSRAQGPELTILKMQRHGRKLQRGAHAANRFTLRLTHLQAGRAQLEQRLAQIKAQGVPNYFGLQRFGFAGGNLAEARHFASQQQLPEQRNRRSRILSAARSYLFNQLLAVRVAEGSWNQAREGDVLAFTGSRSFFKAAAKDCADPRLSQLDLHPTGPLWGQGESPAQGQSLLQEQQQEKDEPALMAWLNAAGLEHERRILRLPIADLTWHYPSPDVLQLSFALASGCFATSVVRELLELTQAEPLDTPCEF